MEGFDPNDIAATIKSLMDSSIDKVQNRTFKRGVIAAVTGWTADVYVAGNTTTTTKKVISLASYQPTVGDKVLMLSIGDSGANLVILGKLPSNTAAGARWIAPTFENGWVNYDAFWSQAGYTKSSDGIVQLRGLVRSGSLGTTIFTLPPGYRIQWPSHSVTTSSNGWADVNIFPDGRISHRGNANGWFSLDNLNFPADL